MKVAMFDIECEECGEHLTGKHCVFLPTLSTYVECPKCEHTNTVPYQDPRFQN